MDCLFSGAFGMMFVEESRLSFLKIAMLLMYPLSPAAPAQRPRMPPQTVTR